MKRIGWFCLIVPAVLAGLTLRLYDRVRFGRYWKYKTSVHLLLVLLAAAGAACAADAGCHANTPTDVGAAFDGFIQAGFVFVPENGIVDSLAFVTTGNSSVDMPTRMALYKAGPGHIHDSLKDTTVEFTVALAEDRVTHSLAAKIGAHIYTSDTCALVIWGQAGPGTATARGTSTDTVCGATGTNNWIKARGSLTKTYGVWPDTLSTSWTALQGMFCYVVYHTAAAAPGVKGRRRRIIIGTQAAQQSEDLGPWIEDKKAVAE